MENFLRSVPLRPASVCAFQPWNMTFRSYEIPLNHAVTDPNGSISFAGVLGDVIRGLREGLGVVARAEAECFQD